MEHLYLPYRIAIKARDYGFNEYCFKAMNAEGTPLYSFLNISNEKLGEKYPELDHDWVAIPTTQQLVDWFYDKHKIHLYLVRDRGLEDPGWRMCYCDEKEIIMSDGMSVYFEDEIGIEDDKATAWQVLVENAFNFI